MTTSTQADRLAMQQALDAITQRYEYVEAANILRAALAKQQASPEASSPQIETVREQAALPEPFGMFAGWNPDTKEMFGSVYGKPGPLKCNLYTEDQMRAAIAQRTTPAAGVGEQAQAEPMSDERIDTMLAEHDVALTSDQRAGVHAAVRGLLAEAGSKEKTNG